MTKSTIVLGLLLLVSSASLMPAGTVELQSILTNINGAQQTDFTGYNTGAFDQSAGIGALAYTFNPGAPGTYFFDVFFDHQLNLPFFNEFGAVLGAPAVGQSYEIGDSFASNIYNDVAAGGALPDTNSLPGQQSNYNNDCLGATCSGDFASALGFLFTLGGGQQAVITLNLSQTDPGSGLRLVDTHPVDPNNSSELHLFVSGDVVDVTVPEPSNLLLCGPMCFILLAGFRRRRPVNSLSSGSESGLGPNHAISEAALTGYGSREEPFGNIHGRG
jgi:hypothetical protein